MNRYCSIISIENQSLTFLLTKKLQTLASIRNSSSRMDDGTLALNCIKKIESSVISYPYWLIRHLFSMLRYDFVEEMPFVDKSKGGNIGGVVNLKSNCTSSVMSSTTNSGLFFFKLMTSLLSQEVRRRTWQGDENKEKVFTRIKGTKAFAGAGYV
ncbi:uncharacterized protein [Rutidosis leptorrhynchoides]|uniref:uncharacterized protein n=1 Tax=Rutidosis leptorrhynchoides TaxID=125765 RepID=UPI003A99174D